MGAEAATQELQKLREDGERSVRQKVEEVATRLHREKQDKLDEVARQLDAAIAERLREAEAKLRTELKMRLQQAERVRDGHLEDVRIAGDHVRRLEQASQLSGSHAAPRDMEPWAKRPRTVVSADVLSAAPVAPPARGAGRPA